MEVIKLKSGGYLSNSYALTADGKSAVVIDPSNFRTDAELKKLGLSCAYVLLTHGHFDHVGGCKNLRDGGARIICGKEEKDFIFSKENLSIFGGVEIPPFEVDKTLSDGQTVDLCGIKITALSAPGHTAGSMCYIAGDCLFSGDALFRMSVGRTDLPTGDTRAYMRTLSKLKNLQGDYKIYAGHGEETTLAFERKNNPYLKNLC